MWPRLIEVGSFTLPTYGVLVALGFLAGISLAARLARSTGRKDIDPEKITNLGIVLLLSAIVGAKLFMIIDNWSYYAADLSRLFSLSALRAGGVFYGGLLAAIGVAYYYTRRNSMPWIATADMMVPGLAVGHGIGRLGCFAAGCCWGRETDVAWAVVFTNPHAHDFTGVPLNVALHPTQLYEALGTLALGGLLLWLYIRSFRPGTVLAAYLVLYSSFRFAVEFFRDDGARPFIYGDTISATQWVAVGLVVCGLWMLRPSARRRT